MDKPILPRAEIYYQEPVRIEAVSDETDVSEKKKFNLSETLSSLGQRIKNLIIQKKPRYVFKTESKKQLAFDIIFYAVIAMIVVGALILSASGNNNIFGVQYYKVLSGSMQRTYPKGSIVFVKTIDPGELSVGDDITFYTDPKTVVTHRVIEIIPNYNNSSQFGFRTKGLENDHEDKDIVYQQNVVGKVVLCIPQAGNFLSFIASYWWLLFGLFILLLMLVYSVKYVFSKEK